MTLHRQLGTKRWSSESQARSVSLGRQSPRSAQTAAPEVAFVTVFRAPFEDAAQSGAAPTKGVAVLCALLASHFDELETLALALSKKVTLEEASAKSLDDLAKTRESTVVASIMSAVSQWSATQSITATLHRAHAEKLSLNAIAPIKSFVAKHKRILDHKNKEVEQHFQVYSRSLVDLATKEREYLNRMCPKRDYHQLFQAADHARSSLEFHITDFLQYAQETSFSRLVLIKEVMGVIESAQTSFLESQLQLWASQMNVKPANKRSSGDSQLSDSTNSSSSTTQAYGDFLTPLDPTQGVLDIAHNLQTGTSHSPTLISVSPHHPPTTPLQAFGISLEALHAATGDPIPPFLRKCVACLYEGLMMRRVKSGLDAWISPAYSNGSGGSSGSTNGGGLGGGMGDVVAMQFLRSEANATCGGIGLHYSRVRRESPVVIAGILKQFLIELPSSVVPSDIYDTLKLIYDAYEAVDMDEDEEIRLKSVSNLLATIPESHFETLKLVCGLLFKTTQDVTDTSPLLLPLLNSLAPLFLRPKLETLSTLQERLPQKLAYDLVRHFPQVFTEAPAIIPEAAAASPNSPITEFEDHQHIQDLESSGFFSPPVTPTLQFSDDDDDDEYQQFAAESSGFSSNHRRKSIDNTSVISSAASRFNEDVVESVGGVFKGLVRTMSGIHMRGNGASGASVGESETEGLSSWFGGAGNRRSVPVTGSAGMVPSVAANANRRSVPVGTGGLATSPLAQGQWSLPPTMAKRFEANSGSPRMLGLDDFDDIEESELEEDYGASASGTKVVCNWGGCGLGFDGNKQLMLHIAMKHMGHSGAGNGVVVIQNQ
ncbi:hypothetical protein BDR26DRAFT_1006471 [Obelidium mucronatum]|nr:hypothetical protein BDR26DRAFT_1006471 [Obelidium mucronatum]